MEEASIVGNLWICTVFWSTLLQGRLFKSSPRLFKLDLHLCHINLHLHTFTPVIILSNLFYVRASSCSMYLFQEHVLFPFPKLLVPLRDKPQSCTRARVERGRQRAGARCLLHHGWRCYGWRECYAGLVGASLWCVNAYACVCLCVKFISSGWRHDGLLNAYCGT